MKKILIIGNLIVGFLFIGVNVNAARILALFPYPAHSHQIIAHALAIELAQRGHKLTVFTADPMNKNITNYTEYSLNHYYSMTNDKNIKYIDVQQRGVFWHLSKVYKISGIIADDILSNSIIKSYLSSNTTEKFDLIILSSGYWDSLHYLSYKLQAPLIVITSLPGMAIQHYHQGNPLLPASFPEAFLGYSKDMNFWQRIHNIYQSFRQVYEYHFISVPMQEEILKKHFHSGYPTMKELRNRASMFFINTSPLIHYPRPMAPKVLPIAGLRIDNMTQQLPKKLKILLDSAKQGFIYFSLGSNMKSSHLKQETLNNLIEVFSELPYLVVWKFEEEALPRKPNNVFIDKWIPQQGVLAHPNIKLFIYQGGLLSTEEAIEFAVPILGLPVFADQWFNINALITKGVTLSLNMLTMTKEEIRNGIREITSNPKYKKNMIKLRMLMRDRYQHPLDEAIWWTEYVIRNKGASHLQLDELPLYKSELWDIYAFFLVLSIALLLIMWKLLKFTRSVINIYVRLVLDNVKDYLKKSKKVKDS